MDIMSQFNLPKYLKGKSFSEASKCIADKFQDRNTPEDQATLKELQGRLRSAQEFVKAKQESATQPQEPMHQMPDGTMMPGATHGEAVQEQPQQPQPEVDPAMMEALQQAMPQENGYGYGGGMNKKYEHGGKMDKANKYEHGGGHVGKYDPYGQFGQLSRFATGPDGGLYKGLDRSSFTEGLSPGMGQDGSYAQLGGFGDRAAQGSMTLPFSPGFAAIGNAFDKRQAAAKEQAQLESDYQTRKDKLSNPVTTLEPYGIEGPDAKGIANQALLNMIPGNNSGSFGKSFGSKFGSTPNTDIGFEQTMGKGKEDNFGGNSESAISEKSIFSGNDTNEDVNKSRSSKFNPGELLRYAAPASTAYQLANLKKPKDVSLGRLTDKYDEQFVDEKAMQNVVEGQAANTRSALQNAAGGSASALRANLLGAQVQSQSAMSQAYNQAAAENRNERRQGQQFNSAVNQANMQQSDKEKEMNLAMQAGYDTNKSRLLAQLGADASGIGQEELFKRFPELAGLGYDYRGKKIK